MTKTYRATPEEWAQVKGYADLGWFSSYSCTFELLHRVQALEAAQQLHTFTADEVAPIVVGAASDAAQPADSLMDRVARAIYDAPNNHDGCWRSEARAALREVAAWLRSELISRNREVADLLEREANR